MYPKGKIITVSKLEAEEAIIEGVGELINNNETYIKGVGKVEEESLTIKQINDKKYIPVWTKVETPDDIIKIKAINILKKQANEQEIETYKKDIIWTDEEYYTNSWKRLKAKTLYQVKQAEKLFQIFSSEGTITGKPQIRNNEIKTNITLLVKAIKKDKEGNNIESYKFIDDPYNRRDDGYEEDVLAKNYWVYDVVDNGIANIVLSENKLENNEVHTFFGTQVQVHHSKEFDKNLVCRGSANLFFNKKAESTIKPLPIDKIIPYVNYFIKKYNIDVELFKKMMFEYIFFHPNGFIYNQPKDYMLLRHAQLLSGKEEGYPLHLFLWGGFGTGKTQEIECIDDIFQENILEAANSTPKSLVPSFSEKIPNPGFILNCNRIALIDEMMKMVDNAKNNTRNSSDFKNQLSNLNFILEHRARNTSSGNGSMFSRPTAKMIVATNPSMKSSYIHQELEVMDPSTFSRCLCYVKGKNHVKFIEQNTLRNCAKTYPLRCINSVKSDGIKVELYKGDLRLFAQTTKNFYVTIYDSCQHFRTKVNQGRCENIFRTLVAISKNPMKTVWKRRGLHHTKLVLDGVIKYRCIFKDFDSKFEAIDEDYDNTERILVGMVKDWDFNMTIKQEDLWKTL